MHHQMGLEMPVYPLQGHSKNQQTMHVELLSVPYGNALLTPITIASSCSTELDQK